MDESEAVEQDSAGVATPIFNVYRRGYDPEQVDRYVTDQQRRLDEALHRSSESERKLAAAVGQLRELHRRVAVYESEARSAQPPALDTLGERVQRILQEAWEGAYNLRQEAEREVNELREQTQQEIHDQRAQAGQDIEALRQVASREAAELVDVATQRALALRDEMERRREAYLERVEHDRQKAVSQIGYLYDQRQLAISELVRLQATVQATIEEMIHSPLAKSAAAIVDSTEPRAMATHDEFEGDGEPAVDVAPAAAASRVPLGVVTTLDEDGEPGLGGPEDDATVSLPSFLDETLVADRRPLNRGSLFDQIIGEEPDAAAEPLIAPHVEEIPTGPMDKLEYGYSTQARHARYASEETEVVRGAENDEPSRNQGGVYDAEADSWSCSGLSGSSAPSTS
ncbi:MAG: hypothetical protein ACYCSF_07100 [Acidimicrobiales bacterium]